MYDTYFHPDYVSLFLEGSDELFEYSYKQDEHWLSSVSIKKRINQVAGIDITEELYDLETDRIESNDLSQSHPEQMQLMLTEWKKRDLELNHGRATVKKPQKKKKK